MAIEIALTNTTEKTVVSKNDYEKIKDIPWYKDAKGYVVKNIYIGDSKWKLLRLHREIMSAEEGQYIDHKNGDKLDNRRENLRFATPLENARNVGINSRNTSGYKGVTERNGKYEAYIRIDGVLTHLGNYEKLTDAAKAYNVKAEEYFGEFARLNDVNHENFKIREKHKPYSEYRGVWYHKSKRKWYAGITVDGVQKHLGTFTDEIEAARTYNKYAQEYHGDKAVLNSI